MSWWSASSGIPWFRVASWSSSWLIRSDAEPRPARFDRRDLIRMRGDSVRRLARVRCRIAPAYSEELSVKHATDHALDRLEPLLRRLRAVDGLRERKRGTFTHRSRAFLHFHEDPG